MRELVQAGQNRSAEHFACSVHRNHHVGSLHHHGDVTLGPDAPLVDRLIGDRGGDDLAIADIDTNVRGGRTLRHFDDGALELVACTDAHDESFSISGHDTGRQTARCVDREWMRSGALIRSLASAYGAAMPDITAFPAPIKPPLHRVLHRVMAWRPAPPGPGGNRAAIAPA